MSAEPASGAKVYSTGNPEDKADRLLLNAIFRSCLLLNCRRHSVIAMMFARVVQWKGSVGVGEAETGLHISGVELKQMEEFAAKVERGESAFAVPGSVQHMDPNHEVDKEAFEQLSQRRAEIEQTSRKTWKGQGPHSPDNEMRRLPEQEQAVCGRIQASFRFLNWATCLILFAPSS